MGDVLIPTNLVLVLSAAFSALGVGMIIGAAFAIVWRKSLPLYLGVIVGSCGFSMVVLLA